MPRKYNYKYDSPFNSDGMDREKDDIHSVSVLTGLCGLLLLWGIFGIVFIVYDILPTALNISDEIDNPDAFIAERAITDLKYLTDLGPKPTGSYENEYAVIDFLTIKTNSIISEAHPNQFIEFDIQNATGGYFLDDSIGFMNTYDKIQNFIVKLHGQNSDKSILINSHFDTVLLSPGGSDDGINVAIMLEILRKLSQSEEKLQQSVIFLFNGAEETPLKGAHAFIAHHKWANETKILVNLESAGAGGKLTLFQTGPNTPWVVKYYAKVPHPFGSVIAEEIFQSGLILSDTDFRVFRDYGNLIGVDMAYTEDGYRYHTKYDNFSNIPSGSYQHGGDNTLALVKAFANASEVSETSSKGQTVYFDVFGLFFIYYSSQTARIVNLVTIVFSIAVFIISVFSFRAGSKGLIKYLLFTTLAIVLSWTLAILFVFMLGFILDLLGKTLSWYGRHWFIFGLYIAPILALSGCLMHMTKHRNLSLGIRSQLQAHLLRILWTLVLIIGTLFEIRSSYLIMIPVLFSSVGFLIIIVCRLQHTVRTWQIIYTVSVVTPIFYLLYHAWLAAVNFIAMAGRSYSRSNPEIYIGAIALLFTLLTTSFLTVLSNLMRRVIWYYLALAAIFATSFALLFTPLGFPYRVDENLVRPQRYWMAHTQRQFFNESMMLTRTDSGVSMLHMDRNSPDAIKPYVIELNESVSIEEDCENYTFCAQPLLLRKAVKPIWLSTWIPMSEPIFPQNETLKVELISKEQSTNKSEPRLINYSLQITGPDRLDFYITPKVNTNLVKTSLMSYVSASKFNFQDRPIYIVLYQLGKGDGTPLIFNFSMQISEDHVGPTVDFAISARYVHEKRFQYTAPYIKFLSEFPSWTFPLSFLAAYQSYEL